MKKLSFLYLLLIVPLVSVFGFAGCGSVGNNEKETVRLCEVTHSIFYAPLYIAINKGFFEDEGLQIELTNGNGSKRRERKRG